MYSTLYTGARLLLTGLQLADVPQAAYITHIR